MKLKKIKLKNIRSYEEQEIVFPEGSVLLAGDVGSGKTSILLAVEYALFGLQPGQTGSALLRNGAQTGEVILELESEGQEIIVERKLRRGNKTITNEYAGLTINGEKKDYAVTELKTRILTILGYPQEFIKKNNLLYRYTVYTPQEQMKQIILEDPEVRLNVLRHVFGIDKYKIMRENLAIVSAKLREEIKMMQVEVRTLELDKERIVQEKDRLSVLGSLMLEKEQVLGLVRERKKGCEDELASFEKTLKERDRLETELEKTKVLRSTKDDALFQAKKEVAELTRALADSIEPLQEETLKMTLQSLLKTKINLDTLQSKHIDLLGQLKNMEDTRKELMVKKERVFRIDICPTCLQDVPEVHKHNILNETERSLANIKKRTEELLLEKETLFTLLEKEKMDLIQLEERKVALEILRSKQEQQEKTKRRHQEVQRLQSALEKDIIMLEKHMATIKEDMIALSRFSGLFKMKQDDLKAIDQEEKSGEIALAELRKEQELMRADIIRLEQSLSQKEQLKLKLTSMLELSDWLSGSFLSLLDFTERHVLLKLRGEFANLFSKWFMMLAGDVFEIRLDENFTPIILQGEVEMEYTFLSGGERTAVALAYRLALNQTINSLMSRIKTKDIVILDEPTDGFSEAQIDKMRDVFDELNVTQLLIVSHEQKIENFVDNVIRLKKELDASAVEIPQEKIALGDKTSALTDYF